MPGRSIVGLPAGRAQCKLLVMQSNLARRIEIDAEPRAAARVVTTVPDDAREGLTAPSPGSARGRSRALGVAIALSLAAHAVAALVVAGYSLRAPEPEPPATPLELVVLVPEPQPQTPSFPTPAEPSTPPMLAAAELPVSETPPVAERSETIPEPSAPLPKARPAPVVIAPAEIRASPPPPAAVAQAETRAQTALLVPHEPAKPAVSDAARAGLIGQYAALLHAQIVRHRIYPEQALRRGEEGTVTLRIMVSRDGALREVKSLSDNPLRLVAASLDAVQAAVPFPPLPAELGSGDEVFEVAVVYKIR